MGGPRPFRETTLVRDTGQGWEDWFSVLARWGAVRQGHRESVRFLRDQHGLTKWWSEEIVRRYLAREAGPRRGAKKKAATYQVSLQKTIAAPIDDAWHAWTRPHRLALWLTTRARNRLKVGGTYEMAGGNRGRYLELTEPTRLRFTWDNPVHCPGTEVEVVLKASGDERSVVKVTHRELATNEDRVRMNEVWTVALASLKKYLEGGAKGETRLWVKGR